MPPAVYEFRGKAPRPIAARPPVKIFTCEDCPLHCGTISLSTKDDGRARSPPLRSLIMDYTRDSGRISYKHQVVPSDRYHSSQALHEAHGTTNYSMQNSRSMLEIRARVIGALASGNNLSVSFQPTQSFLYCSLGLSCCHPRACSPSIPRSE